ncbi:YbbR domain-containing protein [Alteribacillus persepolensis]|uniref:YbbR domain-containing protein n=1 Tax=Alteribacillus persepolensis TaxID=568899 RepID=A0A1G8JHS8_9BACI|nr:CdaR family protein [Alteribacillus persepolensis]SDI30577.1 YbbR domain-containing protein [Alteribacillus persepolensis]
MDKFFNNHWFVKFVSLCIAIMLYLMINMNNMSNQPGVLPDNNDESTHVINDVEVQAYYDEEAYDVVAMQETVDVELTGTQTSILLFQLSRPSYEVFVDVNGREAGVHNVRVEYRDFPADLDVSVTPRFISVEKEKLESVSYEVEADLLNRDQAEDGYTLGGAKVSPSEVTLKAPPSTHEKIETVKAFVDVEGADGRVTSESEVVAYDQNGNEVDVEIEPESVDVEVPVISPFRDVSVQLSREHSLPDGLSVESLNINPAEVTIFGPLEVIEDINAVEATIDISQIEEDDTFEVDIVPPEGVERVQPETVEVEVDVGETEETALGQVPISVENVPEDVSYDVISPETGRTNVTISGVTQVIETITAEDITLTADWEGREDDGSTYTLPVEAEGPANVVVQPAVDELEVNQSQ